MPMITAALAIVITNDPLSIYDVGQRILETMRLVGSRWHAPQFHLDQPALRIPKPGMTNKNASHRGYIITPIVLMSWEFFDIANCDIKARERRPAEASLCLH